jgi:addiction module RelE/StbE family toxin
MSYKLIYKEQFIKKLAKFIKKNSKLKQKIAKTFELLEKNPFHPSLRLHKLQGKLKDFYTISVDMKIRILIDIYIDEKEIFLLDIGFHDDIY